VTLTSSDDKTFRVDRKSVRHAGTIENLITNMGLDDSEVDTSELPIPLSKVNGRTLEKIILWMDHYKDDPDYEMPTVLEILLAANYLDIKGLMDSCMKTVANNIKGHSSDEIRRRFHIVNDFTPEEEEQIERENTWCD
ncbi:hypothetical protein PMAYCL1PPCAC_22586, partial [Pristionchus mayeri]